MTSGDPLPTRQFDLIVMGAGPAGAAAARTAAASGLRTALVDKHRFPRTKLCGGALTGRAISHYRRIFDGDLPDIPLVAAHDVAFHAFGADLGLSRDVPPIHLAMRLDLDAALVAQALQAGAQDFTGKSGALDPEARTVTLETEVLQAPLIIAADGVNSPTAKALFGQSFDRGEIGFALEVELPEGAPGAPLRIDFGAAEWGYGWRFPKAHGTTVGIGGLLAQNPQMKEALARYLGTLGLAQNAAVKGQFLPFGTFRQVPGKGRILLAGDAAGLVDPVTGEGIAHALHSGELAAHSAHEALSKGYPETALRLYRRRLRPIHNSLRSARLLRTIMFQQRFRQTFIHRFRNSRTLRGEYFRLLAGQTEYGQIMRKMAARLPRFALRAFRQF